MCGIIGYTGNKNALEIIIEGLRRLEYRGYDSAGVAILEDGKIEVKRCKGKIADLYKTVSDGDYKATTGIGHTRWATHGRPSVENAHPHRSGDVVLVHNGIIENYLELKHMLQGEGYVFTSETDTEVLCHLVNKHYKGVPLEKAVMNAVKEVRGAYALAAMSETERGKIVALRKDSPLVAGIGNGEYFIASDIPAFLSHSREVVFLDDNDMVIITPKGIEFFTSSGEKIEKKSTTIAWSTSMAEKGGYKHFMLKEIFEQPRSIADTITGRILDHETGAINLKEFNISESALKGIDKIFIVACGTSWHAGMVGKYLIEEIVRVPVEVDIASEFRYRNPVLGPKNLFISITQSGETADTLAAQRLAKDRGLHTLSICNVVGSTASREADSTFYTRSGPEIGVASTKAFTAQIVALYLFSLALGRARGVLDDNASKDLIGQIISAADKIESLLTSEPEMEAISRELHKNTAFLFLGRGINFPIALEGALKLKEISYIHAEGYAAGEMKHGPIALIDEGYPVIVLAPRDELFEKVVSNIQEIRSRGGRIILVTNIPKSETGSIADFHIEVPDAGKYIMPLLLAVPLQLIAYHIGIQLGCDVDQPRNLAKSVTVE